MCIYNKDQSLQSTMFYANTNGKNYGTIEVMKNYGTTKRNNQIQEKILVKAALLIICDRKVLHRSVWFSGSKPVQIYIF